VGGCVTRSFELQCVGELKNTKLKDVKDLLVQPSSDDERSFAKLKFMWDSWHAIKELLTYFFRFASNKVLWFKLLFGVVIYKSM